MRRNEIKVLVKVAAEQAYRKRQLKELVKRACYMSKIAGPVNPLFKSLEEGVSGLLARGASRAEIDAFRRQMAKNIRSQFHTNPSMRARPTPTFEGIKKNNTVPRFGGVSRPTPTFEGVRPTAKPAATPAPTAAAASPRPSAAPAVAGRSSPYMPPEWLSKSKPYRVPWKVTPDLYSAVKGKRGNMFTRYWGDLTGSTARSFANNFEGETARSIARRFDKNVPVSPGRPVLDANYWINQVRPTLTSPKEISDAVNVNNLASVAKQLQRARARAWGGLAGVGAIGGLSTAAAING